MSDFGPGPGWWQASDGQWYPPDASQAVPPPATWGSYSYAPSYPPAKRTNGLAVASLVCGIVGLVGGAFTCGITAPASIVAVVLGHIALNQIKHDPGQEGHGMAIGGVITGWIVVGLAVLLIVALFIGAATSS